MTHVCHSTWSTNGNQLQENDELWAEENAEVSDTTVPQSGLRSVGISPSDIESDLDTLAPEPGEELDTEEQEGEEDVLLIEPEENEMQKIKEGFERFLKNM